MNTETPKPHLRCASFYTHYKLLPIQREAQPPVEKLETPSDELEALYQDYGGEG